MRSFFSGTDDSQLNDRSLSSDYFMMLIVNNAGDYIAKVAFKAKRDSSHKDIINFANNADNHISLHLDSKVSKEVLVVMDMIVVKQPIQYQEHYDEFLTKAKEAIAAEGSSYDITENLKKVVSEYSVYKPRVDAVFEERYNKVKKETTFSTFPNGRGTYSPGRTYSYNPAVRDYTNDERNVTDDFNDTNSVFNSYEKRWGTDKKISEMTDKEWDKFQSLEASVFSTNDYKKFFNGIIYELQNRNDKTAIPETIEKVVKEIFQKRTTVADWIEKNCNTNQFYFNFANEIFVEPENIRSNALIPKYYMIFLNELITYLSKLAPVVPIGTGQLLLSSFITKATVILETLVTKYPQYADTVKNTDKILN